MCHFYYVLKCSAGTGFQFAGPGSQGPVPPGEVTNNLQLSHERSDVVLYFHYVPKVILVCGAAHEVLYHQVR
jgi:hypothetical protein